MKATQVFDSLLNDVRSAAWNVVKLGLAAVLMSWLTVAGLFFLTLAAFTWAEVEFGTLAAAAGLGAFFLALMLAFVAVIRFWRGRGLPQREPRAPQKVQHDRVAAAAIEGLRLLGPRSVFPALALSAVILAATQGVSRSNTKREPAE